MKHKWYRNNEQLKITETIKMRILHLHSVQEINIIEKCPIEAYSVIFNGNWNFSVI
jgi:hypothetical protein